MTSSQKNFSSLDKHKLVVIGDGGVGKSALTIQLIQKQFIEWYDPTIEESYIKTTEIDGKLCLLDVLDTAGQEGYCATREQYIRNGDAFLLVYSVSDRTSFENIAFFYASILRVKNRSEYPIVLVANKCDLVHTRTVTKEQGQFLSSLLKVPYIETSAKNCVNVDLAFSEAVRFIRRTELSREMKIETKNEKFKRFRYFLKKRKIFNKLNLF